MDLDLPRSTASIALLLDLAEDRGMDPAVLLTTTSLTPAGVRAPDGEVTAGEELGVLAALAATVDDPVAVGLELGARHHVTTYGLLGFALLTSPTLRAAVEVGLRHLALSFAFVHLALDETSVHPRLLLTAGHLDDTVRDLVLARDAAALATLRADLGADPSAIRALALALPAPSGALPSTLRDHAVRFDAPTSEVVLDRRHLDAPLPRADAHARAMSETQCRDLLARRRRRTGVAGQVRDRLLADPARMPGMEQVASERHVASRTLRRQLADEGASFRGLVDEARATLAEELLGTAGLTVQEVTHRLGYAEPAAFIHAFRRWTGTTPGAWRDAR